MFVSDMDKKQEIEVIMVWNKFCRNLVWLYYDKLEYDEVMAWCPDSSGACLPLSFRKLIHEYKDRGMHVPITSLPLINK